MKQSNRSTFAVLADSCKVICKGTAPQLYRWTAVYKVIPDERPVIEQTLKEMVTWLAALLLLVPSRSNYHSVLIIAAV